MRSPGLIERFAVRRAVREVLYDTYGPLSFRSYGGSALSEAILAAGCEATNDERLALLGEAKRVTTAPSPFDALQPQAAAGARSRAS